MSEAFNEQLEFLKEALADRYVVERELGAGGMGAVYLARDLKHDRPVAIKVLHPEFAQSLGADRFLREVQVTAKLSHPHILPLYDSGSADGILYYVMPLIEGESLADRIDREKQLPIKDAVQITKEVAGALGYAHSLGLVHRDIKPGNIMLTGGHAIVVDFGIARAADAAGGEKLTQTGMSVGTPAYMSPEQATGEEVDGRSDLYSLGCVLYEMLVGQVPFTGPTPMAIMARHTMDNVPPPTIMREAVPDELEDVIMRAMAKTPADRFQTGMEMVEALEMVDIHTAIHRRPSVAQRRSSMMQRMPEVEKPFWKRPMVWGAAAGIGAVAVVSGILAVGMVGPRPGVAAAGGGLDPRSIAVLYFEDLSPTEDLAHLADGLTEGLISELARLQGLHVVSANAVAAYRESDVPMDSIGRALQTGTLVVGSVAPDRGGRITVTTRLVDGATGGDVGRRQTFTLPADQLLSAPDSVARSVSLILREWLGEEVALARTRAATSNEAAWVAFQRAEKLRKDAEASLAAGADDARALLTRADSLYAEAEAADRRWVDPVVGRGWAVYRRARLERSEEARWLLDALGHAERALALNPGSGAALELRGVIRFRRYELDPNQPEWRSLLFGAKEDLEAAVRADPTLARAYVVLSYVLYQPQIDDVPGALLAARTGYERDAYLRGVDDLIERLFWGNLDLENFTEARRWCDTGAQRFPSSPVFVRCQLWLMATPAVAADPQRAATLIARLDTLLGSSAAAPYYKAEAQVVLGGILGRAGLPDSAQNVLQRVQRSITFEIDPDQELPGRIAYMYTLSGDFDTAIDLLKRYVAANPHHGFLEQAGTVWWWRGIRNHPRYREIEMAGQGR